MIQAFNGMLNKFKSFEDDNQETGESLTKFFGTLRKFNHGLSIDLKLKFEIESYFDFREKNDRVFAFKSKNDYSLFEQLPFE